MTKEEIEELKNIIDYLYCVYDSDVVDEFIKTYKEQDND